VLSLTDVTAGYGATTVLRDVTVHVPDGSVVALLGANGAGKTTLLRVASGLLRAQAGTVLVDGEDVSGHSPHQLGKLGICHVPEGRGVFRRLTVRENLDLFAARFGCSDGHDRALDAFPGLGARMGQLAGTLSGGEQQMLALARAYLTRPRIVLLDEVSMGLAPKLVDEIFAFLGRLSDEGCGLLLVEQYAAKALAIADYACLLVQGRIALVGEPEDLRSSDLAASYLGESLTAAAL
jgi:branched-chain amino acid transport system ATP-binding protein